MQSHGFDVLVEDEHVLGVAKPSGIPTQAPPGIESLETRIKSYLAPAGTEPGALYLGIPHRLDRPASGAMIFAKTRRAARNLAKQFERRRVRKVYWACVAGDVAPASGTWTDHLCKIYGQPKAMVVAGDHPSAQHAVLHYRTIGRHRHGSWLEIELETGRTHQIRIQAASRGHVILGDTHYGGEISFGPAYDDLRLRPIALHARELEFLRPVSREPTVLVAEVDDNWQDIGLERFACEVR
ncbi:MAG: RluA family pseudouridine synthase [Pirellulales bacterium]